MVDEAYIDYLKCKTKCDVSTPDKFSYNKWDIWEETVNNYTQTKIGVTNLSLPYVIYKDTTPLRMNFSELIIYNASFTTSVFRSDSRKV